LRQLSNCQNDRYSSEKIDMPLNLTPAVLLLEPKYWTRLDLSLQLSISSPFYMRVFRTNFSPKPKRNWKKLPKRCSYEKFVCKNVEEIDTWRGKWKCSKFVVLPFVYKKWEQKYFDALVLNRLGRCHYFFGLQNQYERVVLW